MFTSFKEGFTGGPIGSCLLFFFLIQHQTLNFSNSGKEKKLYFLERWNKTTAVFMKITTSSNFPVCKGLEEVEPL